MEQLTVRTRHGRLVLTRHGEGPPVLLLHGIPGAGCVWHPVARRLSEHAQVLVPDLLGFGGSDRPRDLATLHAASQAAALDEALDAIGVDAVTVVGHDFGGPVALLLAGRRTHLVTRLGLLAANSFPDAAVPFPLSAVTWPLLGQLAGRLLFSRASLAMMLRGGTGDAAREVDVRMHLGDDAQVRAIRTIFEGSLRHLRELYEPVEKQLRSWNGPAVVLWGDRDPFFPVEQGRRTAEAVGADLVLLPGAGHFLPQERPEEVAAAIASLLAAPPRVRSARGSTRA